MKTKGGNNSTTAMNAALAIMLVAAMTYSAAVAILVSRSPGTARTAGLPDIRLAISSLKADTASEILVKDRLLLTGDTGLAAGARALEKKSRKILREVEAHFSEETPRALKVFREARDGYDLHFDRLFKIISGGGTQDYSRFLQEISGFVDAMMTSSQELVDRYEAEDFPDSKKRPDNLHSAGQPPAIPENARSSGEGQPHGYRGSERASPMDRIFFDLAAATGIFVLVIVASWWWLGRVAFSMTKELSEEIDSIKSLPSPGRLLVDGSESQDEVRTFVNRLLDLVEFGAREREELTGRITNLQEEERRRSRRDTEELREKNQELFYIKEYYMGIVESITDGIVLLDSNRKIASANKVAFSAFGFGAGDMGRIGLNEVFPDFEAEIDNALSALPGEKVVRLKRVRKDEKCYDISFHPSFGTNGGFDGATVVLEDVTMITELQERVSSVERLASLGRLSAGVAHEIKNPLAGIQITLELIIEREGLDSRLREKLGEIQHEVDRLDGIVNSMLDLARPSSTDCGVCDPARVMDKVLRFLSSRMERNGIKLIRDFSGGVECRFDETRLQQVFMNVVVNAIEAFDSKPGNREIRVSETLDGGNPVFTVADTGPGIPPETAGKVFDPFFTTKSSGTGLGLSITHNILRDFGGDITFETISGKGSIVSIILKGAE